MMESQALQDPVAEPHGAEPAAAGAPPAVVSLSLVASPFPFHLPPPALSGSYLAQTCSYTYIVVDPDLISCLNSILCFWDLISMLACCVDHQISMSSCCCRFPARSSPAPARASSSSSSADMCCSSSSPPPSTTSPSSPPSIFLSFFLLSHAYAPHPPHPCCTCSLPFSLDAYHTDTPILPTTRLQLQATLTSIFNDTYCTFNNHATLLLLPTPKHHFLFTLLCSI